MVVWTLLGVTTFVSVEEKWTEQLQIFLFFIFYFLEQQAAQIKLEL
jgi:uncharacterized protein YhhL (DUF1145 family)